MNSCNIKRKTFLFVVTIVLVCLAAFFSKKWTDTKESKSGINEHEVRLFTQFFLEKAFVHNVCSLEENLAQAEEWMDKDSAALFYSKFSETSNLFWKEFNTISKLYLKELKVSQADYGYSVEAEVCCEIWHLNLSGAKCVEKKTQKLSFEVKRAERSSKNHWGLQVNGLQFLEIKNSPK